MLKVLVAPIVFGVRGGGEWMHRASGSTPVVRAPPEEAGAGWARAGAARLGLASVPTDRRKKKREKREDKAGPARQCPSRLADVDT